MPKRTRVDAASPSCLLEETRNIDSHPNRLLEGLNRLRLDRLFCDVVLCCEGQEFPCHRVVLASLTSYFEAMFTSSMVESTQRRVEMVGVEPEVVEMLVSFAYTSELSISTANVKALLSATDMMDITDVREACCYYMERHVTTSNCVEVHLLADRHSCQKLKDSSMDYILEHFPVVYKQEEFLSVSVDKLTEILSSDHLSVPEEDMVFDAAILWLNTSTERRQTFDKVLDQIRVPLISPSYLHTVMESLDVVKDLQACQRFISEAEAYQRLLSEAEDHHLQSYRNAARPRRNTVMVLVGMSDYMLYSFDPKTNRLRILTRLPIDVHFPTIVTSGALLYVAGGELPDSGDNKEFWCYDLHRGTWSERASMNWEHRSCDPLIDLVVLDGCVFSLQETHIYTNTWDINISLERYDPNSNTWQHMKSVNIADDEFLHSAVALDGMIYIFGGESMAGLETVELERYHPETNRWTMCAPMLKTCARPPVAVVDGMIYVLGTGGGGRDMERYCVETDRWETVGKMPAVLEITRRQCISVRLRSDAPSTPCDTAEDDDEDDSEDEEVDDEDVEDDEDDVLL